VLVVFETELGNITVAVDVAQAPITGENFLKYVDGKFYDGGMVNRAVQPDNTVRHDVEIRVIQFQSDPAREREMKIHQSHTGTKGDYQTETLEPPIKILKAYRK
jgi:cyclophilin family peptidyl-prolyl cis-trans isomerase